MLPFSMKGEQDKKVDNLKPCAASMGNDYCAVRFALGAAQAPDYRDKP
jgi:hypothetical protein